MKAAGNGNKFQKHNITGTRMKVHVKYERAILG